MSNTSPSPHIDFRLDDRSGVPPYLQIVQQVRHALRLGYLQPGDRLPTVREVVSRLPINPNTVFKAYRELEAQGLVQSRPGLGTFITQSLADEGQGSHAALRERLLAWLAEARAVGLDEESIEALFRSVVNSLQEEVG